MAAAAAFRTALEALDAGDAARLAALLAADPALATARAPADFGDDGPADGHPYARAHYAGYFHRPTLLHHVAGNPVRCPLPANAAELAAVLLAAGAAADATCGGGPAQPESAGGTTLGLVASGRQAAESGQAPALVDLLLAHGARAGFDDGGLLWLALYHVVECRRQREVAVHLRRRGAPVDLACAAGLGEADTVAGFFTAEGGLRPGAAAFWPARHAGKGDQAQPSPADLPVDLLAEALAMAAANGRDAVVADLLDRGAPIDGWTVFGPWRVTALHCAAWAGWPETCRLLLDRGADRALRDPTHGGTAADWAAHCRQPEALAALS